MGCVYTSVATCGVAVLHVYVGILMNNMFIEGAVSEMLFVAPCVSGAGGQ